MAMEAGFRLTAPNDKRAKRDKRGYILLPTELRQRAELVARKRGCNSFNDLVNQLLQKAVEEDYAA